MALDEWNAIGEPIADRLGRYANEDDGWFDKEVEYWSEGGDRLVTLELSYLGRHIFELIANGKQSVAASIFNEMELMMCESATRQVYNKEHAWCAELLDGCIPKYWITNGRVI